MHSLICFFQYCFSVFAQKRNKKRDSFTKARLFLSRIHREVIQNHLLYPQREVIQNHLSVIQSSLPKPCARSIKYYVPYRINPQERSFRVILNHKMTFHGHKIDLHQLHNITYCRLFQISSKSATGF